MLKPYTVGWCILKATDGTLNELDGEFMGRHLKDT